MDGFCSGCLSLALGHLPSQNCTCSHQEPVPASTSSFMSPRVRRCTAPQSRRLAGAKSLGPRAQPRGDGKERGEGGRLRCSTVGPDPSRWGWEASSPSRLQGGVHLVCRAHPSWLSLRALRPCHSSSPVWKSLPSTGSRQIALRAKVTPPSRLHRLASTPALLRKPTLSQLLDLAIAPTPLSKAHLHQIPESPIPTRH